jgi:hypothetical protein
MEDFNKVELVEPASLLTEREKWLMEQAFTAARYDNMRTFDEWRVTGSAFDMSDPRNLIPTAP